jgi:hypothetical protein
MIPDLKEVEIGARALAQVYGRDPDKTWIQFSTRAEAVLKAVQEAKNDQ